MEPLKEEFTITSEDSELRAIEIIVEVFKRHIVPQSNAPIHDSEMEPARRVVRYIASRFGGPNGSRDGRQGVKP